MSSANLRNKLSSFSSLLEKYAEWGRAQERSLWRNNSAFLPGGWSSTPSHLWQQLVQSAVRIRDRQMPRWDQYIQLAFPWQTALSKEQMKLGTTSAESAWRSHQFLWQFIAALNCITYSHQIQLKCRYVTIMNHWIQIILQGPDKTHFQKRGPRICSLCCNQVNM